MTLRPMATGATGAQNFHSACVAINASNTMVSFSTSGGTFTTSGSGAARFCPRLELRAGILAFAFAT